MDDSSRDILRDEDDLADPWYALAMPGTDLTSWVISCLLVGLRIAPVFAFAPPFSLTRIPRLFLVLMGLGMSVCLVTANPQATQLLDQSVSGIVAAALREAALGLMFVLAFQIVFGALYLAGRTIDLQAGFGFALLVDPTSQAQMPLVGTLFAYAAGAVFLAFNGHTELLRLLGESFDAVPMGSWAMPLSLNRITGFISLVFLMAMGIAAASVLALFLVDVVIAFLSRTVPQMNVLVLGFQVKSIVLFLVLPLSFGMSAALFLRLMTVTLETIPRMI
jgi:flagellar biosynthetic protein FliR